MSERLPIPSAEAETIPGVDLLPPIGKATRTSAIQALAILAAVVFGAHAIQNVADAAAAEALAECTKLSKGQPSKLDHRDPAQVRALCTWHLRSVSGQDSGQR